MIYSLEDLKEKIEKETNMNFEDFKKYLQKFGEKGLINTGHLSEFYCKVLLGLEWVKNEKGETKWNNKSFDLKSNKGVKFEVKQRKQGNSMEFDKKIAFKFILVVKLGSDVKSDSYLLPVKIYKIGKNELIPKGKAINEKKIRRSYAEAIKDETKLLFQIKKK